MISPLKANSSQIPTDKFDNDSNENCFKEKLTLYSETLIMKNKNKNETRIFRASFEQFKLIIFLVLKSLKHKMILREQKIMKQIFSRTPSSKIKLQQLDCLTQ